MSRILTFVFWVVVSLEPISIREGLVDKRKKDIAKDAIDVKIGFHYAGEDDNRRRTAF